MTAEDFREIALSFPEAHPGSHFDVTDFRVGKKIFATWREADARAVIKLSPDHQQLFLSTSPGQFEPVPGSWGDKGWTRVVLSEADPENVRHAITLAWRSVAPS